MSFFFVLSSVFAGSLFLTRGGREPFVEAVLFNAHDAALRRPVRLVYLLYRVRSFLTRELRPAKALRKLQTSEEQESEIGVRKKKHVEQSCDSVFGE